MEVTAAMIGADDFCQALAERHIDYVTGVPCSYLAGPISALTRQGRYVPAVNEGAALAMACGAVAAGTRAAVMAQNSGLGNLINPLTSLQIPYAIPLWVFMSLRGWPDPGGDEPQHAVMGAVTHTTLDILGVPHWTLGPGDDGQALRKILDEAGPGVESGKAAFVLCAKGSVGGATDGSPHGGVPGLDRAEALDLILSRHSGGPVVATTGYMSRHLFAYRDLPGNFYMQGSMGHAAAFGLGLAMHQRQRVVVLDGDGAALMHLGTMSTIGAAAPVDLLHVIFDNGAYESTGRQPTSAATTDFPLMARAAGYATAHHAATAGEIQAALGAADGVPGPHLLAVRVRPGHGTVPSRATSALPAHEIFRRFAGAVEPASTRRTAARPAFPAPGQAGVPASRTVIFAAGAMAGLADEVRRYAPGRILIVASDQRFAAARIRQRLADWPVRLFSGFMPNPALDDVLAGCGLRDSWQPGLIIGLGGGSAMDVAKAIRALPAGHAAARQALHSGHGALRSPRIPLILIPTTAGTGSEITGFATLFDGQQKVSLDVPGVAADLTIVDPLLAGTCPLPVTSSCALDSVCHATESLWNVASTPASRGHAITALRLAAPLLGHRLDPLTEKQREILAAISLWAGTAISVTRTTAAHAFAYRLTSQFSVPHGVACTIHLRWLYEHNVANASSACLDSRGRDFVHDRLTDIARSLGASPARVPSVLSAALSRNGWPLRLRDYGVSRPDLPSLIECGLGHRARSGRNPVAVSPEAALAALERLL
jgi:phosphonopyruvate decarboxylase